MLLAYHNCFSPHILTFNLSLPEAPAVTSTTPRASVIRNSLTPSGYPLSPSEPPYSPEFTHATATTITVLSPPQIYEHRNSASLSNNSNSNSKRNTMDPPAEIEAGAVTINRTQTPPPRINAPSPVSPHLSFDGNFPMSPVSPMDDVGSLRGYGDSGAGMASLSGSISSCSIGPAAYTRSRGASTGEDGMLSLQPSTKRVAGQVKRKPVPGTADSA